MNRAIVLALVASLGCAVAGCAGRELPPPSTPIETNPTISPAVTAAASTPSEAAPQSTPVAQAPVGVLFCSATADGNTREVYLDWKGNKASGTLRTSAGGVVKDEPVKAERSKARVVLADPAKAAAPKATIRLEGDAKKLQVGDGKQPWTSCR